MDRQLVAVLAEVIPNPAGAAAAVAVASLPRILVAAFGSTAVVGAPGMAASVLEVVPSHED
jgi:hypothetical protein